MVLMYCGFSHYDSVIESGGIRRQTKQYKTLTLEVVVGFILDNDPPTTNEKLRKH